MFTYNWDLGMEFPSGSRGRASGQRSEGHNPPEAETLLAFGCSMEVANLPPFYKIYQLQGDMAD